MPKGLGAIRSINFCFSTQDYVDSLLEIDILLRNLASKPAHAIDTAEKKRVLEEAFTLATCCLKEIGNQKADKELTFLLAEILCKFGKIHHEDNYFAARQIFLASLNLHLYSIGLVSECINMREFTSLDDLKIQSDAKPQLFAFMEHLLLTPDSSTYVTAAMKNTFLQENPGRRFISLAQCFRLISDCTQHLDAYQTIDPEHESLFNTLFQTAESLLLLADNDESKLELAELYLATETFIHERQHPKDADGICALYDKALACNPSKEMQARIANKRFNVLFKNNREDEAFNCIRKAKIIAETLEDTEANRYHLAALYYNFACAQLNEKHFDIEQAEIHLTRATRYASLCRERGRDHMCFALFDMLNSQFKMATGNFLEAKPFAERAIETLKKYPHSQQPHIFKAEALLSLINKMLAVNT